jgi:hypothetical protein
MTEYQKIRTCLLAPVGTAMGAKLPESGRESMSSVTRFFAKGVHEQCHSIFRVMLFCLDGVTHTEVTE